MITPQKPRRPPKIRRRSRSTRCGQDSANPRCAPAGAARIDRPDGHLDRLFEAAAEQPPAAESEPLTTAFPAFEDIDIGATSEAALTSNDAGDDFLIDPFSDSFSDAVPAATGEPAADATQPEPPAAPFVTETMAELYLQQGFTAEALEVYPRQLSEEFPGDENLKERVRKLERGDRTSLPLDIIPEDAAAAAGAQADGIVHDLMPERAPRVEAAAGGATARSYFAGLAARRAVQGTRRARTAPRTSAPARGLCPGPRERRRCRERPCGVARRVV